jgi:hypothetical protein
MRWFVVMDPSRDKDLSAWDKFFVLVWLAGIAVFIFC